MKLTQAIVKNILKTQWDDLPEEVVQATKRSILDCLGVMFPPTTLENACISLWEIVEESGGRPESTLVGFGGKSSCLMAAFLNGSLAHALDYDDSTEEPFHHPTASSLPAALAISDRIGAVSGKELITSIAVANDLGIRLASAPKGKLFEDYPWFAISFMGVFSATAATGRLLDLSDDQMTSALGIALHRVAGITKVVTDPNSELRALRDGFTNREGLLASLMAGKNITACQNSVEKLFEVYYGNAYDAQVILRQLGEKFRGIEAGLKFWPCFRLSHGYIQAAREIVQQSQIKLDQIEKVTLQVGEYMVNHYIEPASAKQNPITSIAAKFSIPFIVGATLAKGNVGIGDFLPQNLKDAGVLAMAKKITYELDHKLDMMSPAMMDIQTKNGQVITNKIEVFYGRPDNPLTEEDLITKFKGCATYSKNPLSAQNTDQLIDMIATLEEVKDIKEITALLT